MITQEQGVSIAGRYTLVRPLARGGMGSVWIARHRDLEIDVTVKFMAPALVASAEARTRFEREARVAARLNSQHVVQVLDYGVEDGTPYIAMELLKGESLSARLTRESRLALPITARLLVQICKALRTAHEEGLVHRDLKPGNIFLALKDGDEVAKVLDFGIAKAASFGDAEADTASGVMLGSVHYMSPEQIRSSRTVDHRSDLWSIGVILYRVLTGRLPFPGAELGNVLVSVCTAPIPPPSSITPDLPARIDRFFERALARDLDQRFQSASELAEAFSAMALAAPTQSPPPPARWGATIPIPPGQVPVPPAPPTPPMQAVVPPPPRARQPSGADELTFAAQPVPDATMGSIQAVLVPDPRTDSSQRIVQPPAVGGRVSVRSWWPIGAVAAVVALAGILGVVLRSGATSGSPEAPPTATESAPPPVEPTATTVPPLSPTTSASGVGSATTAPTPTTQPRPPAREPKTPAAPTSKPKKPRVEGPLETTLGP